MITTDISTIKGEKYFQAQNPGFFPKKLGFPVNLQFFLRISDFPRNLQFFL